MKLIHAHETANVANAKPSDAVGDVVLGEGVGQLVGRDPERDHEGQVEEQLQRGRRPVRPRAGRGRASAAGSAWCAPAWRRV